MQDNDIRLKALGLIWGALTVIMLGLFYTVWMLGEFSVGHIIVASLLCLGATAATLGIVIGGEADSASEKASKAKSGDRINRLLDKLSDDDMEALRQRLMEERGEYALGQDGELVRLHK